MNATHDYTDYIFLQLVLKTRRTRRGCESRRLWGKWRRGRRSRACLSVWLPADTNMALSVLCQSDINQSWITAAGLLTAPLWIFLPHTEPPAPKIGSCVHIRRVTRSRMFRPARGECRNTFLSEQAVNCVIRSCRQQLLQTNVGCGWAVYISHLISSAYVKCWHQ